MKNILIIFSIFLSNFIFSQSKVIYIKPLGQVNPTTIQVAKESIESFYGYQCRVLDRVEFTNDILAASKTRYEASKILGKYDSDNYTLILTEKDIACHKGQYPEWGIFGLGMMPGKVCVVSTYRIKRGVNQEKFFDRLRKITLHEIGHNLGLNHCDYDLHCLMNDANGTIKQVDREKIWMCNNCKKQISK